MLFHYQPLLVDAQQCEYDDLLIDTGFAGVNSPGLEHDKDTENQARMPQKSQHYTSFSSYESESDTPVSGEGYGPDDGEQVLGSSYGEEDEPEVYESRGRE